jgi:thioredoxin-related protein
MNRVAAPLTLLALLAWLAAGTALAADDPDAAFEFDDFPLENLLQYPTWFKKSFLDLREDLEDAKAENKQGIIVYFGQRRCAYCKMLMEVNFKLTDIVTYTRRHFDVIPIDIWSPEEMTDPAGNEMSQRQFAVRMGTNFTPSLLFYDTEGRLALRLRGYYPPYQFRAALEYVAGGHYQREAFAVYMARGDSTQRFEKTDLNEQPFFIPPPHNLDRSHFPGQRPLVVFFEQGDCHACDVLHTQPLNQPTIHKLFDQFDNVQLDMWSDQPVITPDGRSTTARQWAQDLGLFYAPSILFFDEHGEEIIRVDSVVRFFRLRNVLNYVISHGYKSYPDFQSWRVNSGL